MQRIKWVEERHEGYRGHVNGRHLFDITWRTRRDDPSWVVTTQLPGNWRVFKHDELKQVQAFAEKVLAKFVESIGAVFPEEEEETP